MAGKYRGVKSFKIGKKTHKLRLRLETTSEIEEMADQTYRDFLEDNFLGKIPRIKPSMIVFKCTYMEATGCDEAKAAEVAEQYYLQEGCLAVQTLILDFVGEQLTLGQTEGGGDSAEEGN